MIRLLAFLMLTAVVSAQNADEALRDFYQEYLEASLPLSPTSATRLGDHRFDAQLDDVSPAGLAKRIALARRTLEDLPKRVAFEKLSRDGQIDYAAYFRQLKAAGYRGQVVVEVSGQIHMKPGYDPIAAAKRSYSNLAPVMEKTGLRKMKSA